MNSILKKTFLFLALVPFVLLLGPQVGMSSGAKDRTTKSSQQGTSTTMPMMPMPLVAPLFIVDEDFTSTLVLVNGSALKTYADVVLRAPDGTQVAQKRVTFGPHSQRTLDVGAVLRAKGSDEATGSVVVMPSADLKGPAILAALSMTYLAHPEPNFIDEELAMPSSSDSQVLRGVADRGEGSPLVAVTSLADMAQHVKIDCLGREGIVFSKTITLTAGGTVLTEACSNLTRHDADFASERHDGEDAPRSVTGIALTSDGMPGSFAAFGLVPHQKAGAKYYSSVPFTDPMMLKSPNSVFAGVPVGPTTVLGGRDFVPELSLANFSANAAQVTIQYAATSGDTPSANEVRNVAVPPGQTREVVLDNLQGAPDLKNSFLVLSSGMPGDLLAKLVAKAPQRLGEVELLAKDQMDPDNVGIHPWSTADGTESTLLLFNHSTGPQTFQVHLSSGGAFWHKNYELQSMQTEEINIGELIANKTPDDSGKTIPSGSKSGVATWMLAHHGVGKGRILQSNAGTGMARSFSCNYYGTVAGAEWSSNTSSVPDGQTVNVGGVTAMIDLVTSGNGCTGTFEDYGSGEGYEYSYSSSNSSVAAVTDPTGPNAEVEGISDGAATIYGSVTDPEYGCEGFASGDVNTVPSITSISPNTILVGTNSVQLTISGKGFGSSPVVNLPLGVTAIPNGQASTDSQILIFVSVSINAPIGPNSLTVTANKQTSNNGSFTLDGPFYMVVDNDFMGHCGSCSTTVERFVTYQVMNFSGTSAGTIPIGESFTPVAGWNCTQSNPGVNPTQCSEGETTHPDGTFTDGWSLNSDSFTPAGCGETGNNVDHWLWCKTSRSIGTLTGWNHTNAVSINGYVNPPNQMPVGHVINP